MSNVELFFSVEQRASSHLPFHVIFVLTMSQSRVLVQYLNNWNIFTTSRVIFSFFKRSEHSDTWLKTGPVGEIRNGFI